METNKNIYVQCILSFVLFIAISVCPGVATNAQTVSGPTCIVTGTQYTYNLSEYDYNNNNYNFSFSISGGTSTVGSSGSYSGSGPGNVSLLVTWNNGITTGNITLTSSMGNSTLTVSPTPVLVPGTITSGQTQNLTNGSIPATINCSVATGGSCSPSYTYQWQSSPNNVTYTNITGSTGQNLSFTTGLTTTTYYRRMVTVSGTSAYSTVATITVYPVLIAGSVSPTTQTINYNTNASVLTLSGVSGGTNSYSYQWLSSTDNYTFINVTGATASTYTPTALTSTIYYQVAVTSNSQTLYTSSVSVFVNPQLLPGVISPTYIPITTGTSPGILTGTTASFGGCGGSYSYQWMYSTNGTTYNPIPGATSQNYTPGALSANFWGMRKVTCGTAVAYSDTIQVVIVSGTPDINFIRVRDITKAGVLDSAAASALTSNYDVAQTSQYFDGLGRQIQTVGMQQSPLQKDLVSLNVYDPLGREAQKYMPYVATTTDGNYKPTALADGTNFNMGQYLGENYYYSQTAYEPSPLNRVAASYAPGNSWIGSARGIGAQYSVNTVADSVRYWKIAFAPGSLPTTTSTYAPGTLYENTTTDEAGHSVIEYKDIEGKVVLKKVQLAATPGTAHAGWLCTYYIYDDLNHLRFVIQPVGVQLINANWTLTTAIADELCFRYEYDYRGKMIIKKIPGAGEAWMVYDLRDRLVMSQDSSLRFLHKWMFVKYDDENRPDSTGLITDNTNYNNLSYHQAHADTSTSYPSMTVYTTNELLTQTYYDDYSWVSGTGSGLGTTMATSYNANSTYFITGYNTSPTYSQPLTQFNITRGMATGAKTKVVGTASQFLYAVNLYDDRGRTIQTQSINYTGGIDTSLVQYSFNSKPLRTLLLHKKAGTNAQAHKVLTKMNYDGGNRLLTIYKNIDNAGSDQLIATNTYNELGQLQNKALGNSLENLAYAYNIRGWLTSINKNFIQAGGTGSYFGMELGYDKPTSVNTSTTYNRSQYNGNITGTLWKTAGDDIGRKYDFTYDSVNRFTGAKFLQNTTGSTWDSTSVNFGVNNMSYDANGNILTMNQEGFTVGGSAYIDKLTYTYQTNSNKLSKVDDAQNDPNSKLGDFHYTGTKQSYDYTYDGNGNLTLDNNKAISGITYNYLNLPNQVTVTAKGTISYTYDAGGNKLVKTTVEGAKTTTTLYLGGIVYQNDTLQFMAHEEGRARWALHKYTNGTTGYGFEYDYFLKDHLGNTRMVLTQEKDTAKYMATMEAAYRTTENQLFYNIPQSSYPRVSVPGYPSDPTTNPNDSLAKVNGSGQKIGPSIILKVMAGDSIDIAAKSYWVANGNPATNSSLTDALTSLANGIIGLTNSSKGTLAQLNTTGSPLYNALNTFITNNETSIANKPKGYLNWMLLDEQFNYVNTYPQSGAIPISNFAAGTLGTPGYTEIPITKSGYLYIYVSNESQGWDVFFDNLTVQHRTGPITEETHYYPFGLTMAGISSKALNNSPENKYKYNKGSELQNKEFSDGSGLEMYGTMFRELDPQLGRWWQIDPKPNPFYSPYSSMDDNPILHVDPLGDTLLIQYKGKGIIYNNGALSNKDGSEYKGKVKGFLKQVVNSLNKGVKGSAEAKADVGELQGSKNNFTIVKGNTNKTDYNPSQRLAAYANQIKTDPAQAGVLAGASASQLTGGSGSTITWNPNGDNVWVTGGVQDNNPTTNLFHELGHAVDDNRGLRDDRAPDASYPALTRSEWQATYRENVIRQQLGLSLRTNYLSGDTGTGQIPYGPSMLDTSGNPILPSWYTP